MCFNKSKGQTSRNVKHNQLSLYIKILKTHHSDKYAFLFNQISLIIYGYALKPPLTQCFYAIEYI